jgi:hypothetical protein
MGDPIGRLSCRPNRNTHDPLLKSLSIMELSLTKGRSVPSHRCLLFHPQRPGIRQRPQGVWRITRSDLPTFLQMYSRVEVHRPSTHEPSVRGGYRLCDQGHPTPALVEEVSGRDDANLWGNKPRGPQVDVTGGMRQR